MSDRIMAATDTKDIAGAANAVINIAFARSRNKLESLSYCPAVNCINGTISQKKISVKKKPMAAFDNFSAIDAAQRVVILKIEAIFRNAPSVSRFSRESKR